LEEVHEVQNEERKDPEIEENSTTEPESEPSLTLQEYKNCLLLTGDTKPHSEKLKELRGKWNSSLGGWAFSYKRKESVEAFIASIVKKEASIRRRDEKKAKRVSKLKFNEELNCYVDHSYEFLFHSETKEAFARMDDNEDIYPLNDQQIKTLIKKGYTVMTRREGKKYLKEYLGKAKPLTEKLVEHPKLERYLILEEHPYLFTSDKVAFCILEGEECGSLSRDDISWLKDNEFEVLSKRDRKKEINTVEEIIEELNELIESGTDSESDSESDVDLDSEND
jgi:hypothetical protein